MAQSDLVKVAIGAAVGAFVAAVAVMLVTGRLLGGDTNTDVALWQEKGGPCQMTYQKVVTVKQKKNLIWKIRNYCRDGATVAVGNFSSEKIEAKTDCSGPGKASPFPDQQPASVDVPPGEKRQIKLKAKKLEKPDADETYYFEICLNRDSIDPTLMIER